MADIDIVRACGDDAEFVANCITVTSEGIVDHLLDGLFPSMHPVQILSMVLMDGSTQFCLDNMWLLRQKSEYIGLVFMYPAKEQRVPEIMRDFLSSSRVDPVKEILSVAVENSLYINTFWVHENWRGSGIADVMLEFVQGEAVAGGHAGVSLHVWADNTRAVSFYTRHGFQEYTSFPSHTELANRHPAGSRILWKPCRIA